MAENLTVVFTYDVIVMAEGGVTPRTVDKSFVGFDGDSIDRSGELNAKLSLRRLPEMQETIEKMMVRMESEFENRVG